MRDGGELYGQRLLEAGVPTTVSRYDGMIHSFMHFGRLVPQANQALDEVNFVFLRLLVRHLEDDYVAPRRIAGENAAREWRQAEREGVRRLELRLVRPVERQVAVRIGQMNGQIGAAGAGIADGDGI